MKFKPLNNYVTLKLIAEKEDDILLPDRSKAELRWAHVLDAGPGVPSMTGQTIPCYVSGGDIVYVMSHGRELIKFNELDSNLENINIASEYDIMCKAIINNEKLSLQPLGVLIEIEKIDQKDEDRDILIVDSKKTPPTIGKVISIGKGFRDYTGKEVHLQVKEGDLVIFDPYKAMIVDTTPLGFPGKRYLVTHGDIWMAGTPDNTTVVDKIASFLEEIGI